MKVGRIGAERTRGLLTGVAAVILTTGALTLGTGLGHAADGCAGLAAALRRDRAGLAAHEAGPDALSAAGAAVRRSAMKITERRLAGAGCPVPPPLPSGRPEAVGR